MNKKLLVFLRAYNDIDHIIPVSYFTSIDQMKECFALSNLKPEWAEWNAWKKNRFMGSSEDYPHKE